MQWSSNQISIGKRKEKTYHKMRINWFILCLEEFEKYRMHQSFIHVCADHQSFLMQHEISLTLSAYSAYFKQKWGNFTLHFQYVLSFQFLYYILSSLLIIPPFLVSIDRSYRFKVWLRTRSRICLKMILDLNSLSQNYFKLFHLLHQGLISLNWLNWTEPT